MGAKSLRVVLLSYTDRPEEKVATAAKLCYSGADLEKLLEGIAKSDQSAFIRKLVRMGHYSPIEHASFTFGVQGVSRSLLAQITRHRIASFSVKSQRYVKEGRAGGTFDYIVPPRIQALGPRYVEEYNRQMQQVQSWYDFWLEALAAQGEHAKEDARFVLPNATETKLMVTMNARELHHFFNLRCCNRAQWEIRALATEMLRLVKGVAPVLFEQAGPRCVKGACPEGDMSCGEAEKVREFYKNLA